MSSTTESGIRIRNTGTDGVMAHYRQILRRRIALMLLLLLLNLCLALALQLQRLLTLRWRLFIPRYFIQLCRLLAHIGLHLSQQLTLFVGQLIRVHDFTTG